MTIRKLLTSTAAAVLTLVAMPDEASAFTGYVCEAHFRHFPSFGQHGYVYVNLYSQPNCGGSWVVGAVFCSTGGTGNQCSAPDLSTSVELQALIQNLQRAAAADQKLDITATTSGAGQYVQFRAD